ARTRNPLYLGNLLITIGLCVIAHDPILLALVAILFAAQYRAIIAAEEEFLRGRFGARFEEYRARVPRFLPGLLANRAAGRPWAWPRALRQEHKPLAARA